MSAALSYSDPAYPGPGSAPRLALNRITLSNFRCYQTLRLDPGAGLVVLTGANGAGKTNLLEALSLLSPGRGLRGARLAEISRHPDNNSQTSAPEWAVAAEFATPHGALSIGVGWAEADGERRAVRINGAAASGQTALSEHISMVWLTPAMDRLFVEAPAGRRRFLDRLVFAFDPAHAGRLQAYDKARRERARLLREGRADESWLGALERNMAERAVAIAAARLDLIERLKRAIAEESGSFPRPEIAVRGVIEDWIEQRPALEVEENYRAALERARPEDGDSGSCEGVHRSDLMAKLGVNGPDAEQASTGEQKAILISLILAHGRLLARLKGRVPVLLLDEITAHLDSARRQALFEAIEDLGAQAWLTGTDEALFTPIRQSAQFYSVANGRILKQETHG
ncbi:MAG: DNA replication/repair protein RecF [Rhodospirillaceae bacterium]|nr:DNA replication/repair protein RecF [Rhodospirillaceae bacterium]MBT3628949.1 DNA replication/repair protein RecF [Rhodospirillaceae bacterium]MBT3928275.1 DNA replication/repair protein RecF [Rhodospirillaceae bacterium]MBT4426723.1 DNA replication/repair protein RecF [Rhodospirillaceae bacterium]MBT5039793.1 DNA replication/repair protein RecF [Rhodospirillaceae bacterium]